MAYYINGDEIEQSLFLTEKFFPWSSHLSFSIYSLRFWLLFANVTYFSLLYFVLPFLYYYSSKNNFSITRGAILWLLFIITAKILHHHHQHSIALCTRSYNYSVYAYSSSGHVFTVSITRLISSRNCWSAGKWEREKSPEAASCFDSFSKGLASCYSPPVFRCINKRRRLPYSLHIVNRAYRWVVYSL